MPPPDDTEYPALPGEPTDNLLKDINVLKPDGTCNRCEKNAQSEQLKCFSCEKRYHVIECTAPKLCTPTFLRTIWPNLESSYPCITFICQFCRENKKLKDENIMMDRVSHIEQDIREMKQLLVETKHNQVPAAPIPAPTFAQITANKPAAIVIKPSEDTEDDQDITEDNLEELRNIAIEKSAEVLTTYKNRQGNQVIVCQNEKSKAVLMPHLTEKFPNKTIVTPPPRWPTITIKDIQGKYETNQLHEVIKRQNERVEVSPDNFKVIFTKEVHDAPGTYYAVARVSDKVRDQLKTNRNALCIGLHSCKVRDRFFVRRCNHCQELGHFHGQCKAERPICAKCSGSHDTRTCQSTRFKCHNCTVDGSTNTNHATYSPKCPVYIAAQEKVKDKISYYQKN